jgi:prepilin-type N-terminal cleavage/methylation domain-containing protein/prepilin-type processing-associated H-X9-DG protein
LSSLERWLGVGCSEQFVFLGIEEKVMDRPSKVSQHSNCRRGFTIIELLVVVTVIAVLISILMPALGRTREMVNLLTCQANLRQISQATIAYAQANNNCYPYCAVNEMQEDWVYWQSNRNLLQGGIIPYLSTKNPAEVLICPDDRLEAHINYPNCYPFSYSMNINVGGYYPYGDGPNGYNPPCYPGLPNRHLIQIKHPQNCIIFIDESELTIDDGCWAWQPEDGAGVNLISDRHDQINNELRYDPGNPTAGRGNAAFCDGHVSFISRSDTWNAMYYNPNR